MSKLAKTLLGWNASPETQVARKLGGVANFNDQNVFTGYDWSGLNQAPTAQKIADTIKPIQATQDISNGVSMGQLGKLGVGAIKSHPLQAAGLGMLGAGNIGGLMDNDKFGGQIGGLALGGLGSVLAEDALGPYGKLMLTLGGGQLGALFDKLRARKEMEQAQGYPNAGNPVAMMNRR